MKNQSYIYTVLVCGKSQKSGIISSECYSTLEKAQAFCASRYNTKKVSELIYSSDTYDYKIHILNLR